MFLLQQPTVNAIDRVLSVEAELELTYPTVGVTEYISGENAHNQLGSTAMALPKGYVIDHNRIRLGSGRATYERAKVAIRQWQMFNLGWVQIRWTSTITDGAPIEVGTTVGVLASVPLWSFNPCRIVYTVDELDKRYEDDGRASGPRSRFGFGYGTLPGHLAKGEERFQVEWYEKDDSVWYDIVAISKPNHILAKVGYPVMRLFQKRFAQDSKRAMLEACCI